MFDWQVTPVAAIAEYIRRDFAGMFEREDLHVVDGVVFNKRFGTNHMHEFPKDINERSLDALYGKAREGHDGWCAVTRRALKSDLSTLFVLSRPASATEMAEISGLIEQTGGRRQFLLLAAPRGDHDDHWTGDHEIWKTHLTAFRIRTPLSAVMAEQMRRLRKNIRYLKPPSMMA
ncbi:hypothetical protein EDC40_10971 [Aminobacter aminovorans]|uniref:Uncharacterized protein n=1 Tax=Aminobacter aminovorans TaxID=83263 RepID=A0A380WKJ6_AMIAI|nr:hypothetical protein [Aminobacter aminovorans]TCS24204.1 hypothetical protein EDC40_10971 [Aminobacter aminovorans]SUU89288.1 Uncharacterised protein [Aminobacter aminovorans]